MSDIAVGEVVNGSPLEFTCSVELPSELPLDEVVHTSRVVENWGRVTHYGVVDHVEMTSSTVYQARVRVLRIEPELFVPPLPGSAVFRAEAKVQEFPLRFDEMRRRMVAGMLADGQPAYFNLDFLNGSKGAHLNIAGISGVATKTSYALFLLYALFQSHPQSPAIVFNVKGDDLLYLDRPNSRLTAQQTGSALSPPLGDSRAGTRWLWALAGFFEGRWGGPHSGREGRG